MGDPDAVRALAPGKVILLGEHAVVYGEPSLSLALDRGIEVTMRRGDGPTTVDGSPLHPKRHAYISVALDRYAPAGSLVLATRSDLPSAVGLGTSAALSVATVAAAMRLTNGSAPLPERVARAAFDTEYRTQGAGSPNDTTVSTAGGAVVLSPIPLDALAPLWRIEHGDRAWHAHRLDADPLRLVVASSGTRSRTAEQVARVRRRIERDAEARAAIPQIGALVRDGIEALRRGDLVALGAHLDHNEELLARLGVETPELRRVLDLARSQPGTLGAKLTGAGGGGSILALSERPERLRAVLGRPGRPAFVARTGTHGFEVDP